MHDPIAVVAEFLRLHIAGVTFGMTAVSLMLAGPVINGGVQRAVQRFHWLVRYAIFVLLCTVGYGFLTNLLYRGLARWLLYQQSLHLIIIVTVIYLALAFFARKQGHI